ncbi:MAG TPA: nucleotidyltransferase domain-containing protein, partial [Myxococcota bacterium]
GSRARGDATADSDVDVACFADVVEAARDARRFGDVFLDGFVYPTAVATAAPTDALLTLDGGQILLDERGLAQPLLGRVALSAAAPVPALSSSERELRRSWARKMLLRIRRDDVEAHYRRHWLLFQLLEDHYALRQWRYRGPKLAFIELAQRAPATMAAFAAALAPGATLAAIEALVAHIEAVDDDEA